MCVHRKTRWKENVSSFVCSYVIILLLGFSIVPHQLFMYFFKNRQCICGLKSGLKKMK